MPRAAIYARVSTTTQDPEVQLARLREAALARGWEPVEFVDVASGRRAQRPAFEALRRAARRREVDVVVAVKLDRLARSVRDLGALAEELEACTVDLVCLDQHVDTTTPAGKLLFHVLAAVGEFEADLIRERTLDGLAAARRRGVRLGRRPKLDRRQIARARRLRKSGRSLREIARLLGVSHPVVLDAVRDVPVPTRA